jgi:hypothetical protein
MPSITKLGLGDHASASEYRGGTDCGVRALGPSYHLQAAQPLCKAEEPEEHTARAEPNRCAMELLAPFDLTLEWVHIERR